MVLQGGDLNSSSRTIITPRLLNCAWWQFWLHDPMFSHQDGVCLDWFKIFTASQPFQLLIISIMNGFARLRLVYGISNGHCSVFFSPGRGQSWLGPCPLFTQRLSEFGQIWAVHSISTLPMSHCKYIEWFCKVEIWIHHPQPSPHPGFWVVGGDNFGSMTLCFHTKMEYAWIDSRFSQHLNPTNLSL